MKKEAFLLIGFVLIFGILNAQKNNVQKNMVLIEIATGTWCGYCPGAAMAVDQMVEEGLSVAVIENHGGDSYETSGSLARNEFYGITAFPTAKFNGTEEHMGGGTQSIYSTYKEKYDKSVNEVSNYSLHLTVVNLGNNKYKATVLSNNLEDNKLDSTHIFVVVTESHIPESWMGQSELNFVNRLVLPNKEGLYFCYSCSGTFYENFEFELKSGWNADNIEVVAFVQEMNTKEVLQSDKAELPETIIYNDVALLDILLPENLACESSYEPVVQFENKGIDELHALTVLYKINNSPQSSEFIWSGVLEANHVEEIVLPAIDFIGGNGVNSISVTLVDPNNLSDEISEDNYMEKSFEQYWQKSRFLQIHLSTDYNGDETSWELVNSNNDVILSGSGYESGAEYNAFVETKNNDCYRLNVYDSGDDGIDQVGFLRLIDFNTQKLIYEIPQFDSEYVFSFGSNYKFNKSLQIRNKYNNPIAFADTISLKAYSKDSMAAEMFSVLNTAPILQYLHIKADVIDGNENILSSFLWNGSEVTNEGDSILLNGEESYNGFKAIFRPDNEIGSTLIRYKIWIGTNPLDFFEWYINFESLETPPVDLQLMNSAYKLVESGDSLLVENIASEMKYVTEKMFVINNSIIDVDLKLKRTVLEKQSGHDLFFNWNGMGSLNTDNPEGFLKLLPGDSIVDFTMGFNSNNVEGKSIVRYTFYNADNLNDSACIVICYKSKANPYFKLSVLHNDSEINAGDTITYELKSDDENQIKTILGIQNLGNYTVNLQLNREVLLGLGKFIDTTYWGGNFYLGANQVFPNVVNVNSGELGAECHVTFDPPYRAGSYLIKLSFFESENMENDYPIFINYLVEDETGFQIERENAFTHVQVYPNPVNNVLNVKNLEKIEGATYVQIEIVDLNGQVLNSKNNSLDITNCSISTIDLLPGVYFLLIKTDMYTDYVKFIKVK